MSCHARTCAHTRKIAPCSNVRSTRYASPPSRTWLMYGWELTIVISPSKPATGPRAYRAGRPAKARRDRAALARPVVKISSWAPMYLTMPAWRAPWTAWLARAPRDAIIVACPSPHTKRPRVIDDVIIQCPPHFRGCSDAGLGCATAGWLAQRAQTSRARLALALVLLIVDAKKGTLSLLRGLVSEPYRCDMFHDSSQRSGGICAAIVVCSLIGKRRDPVLCS